MSSSSKLAFPLADLGSDTTAALWTKIYSFLDDRTKGRSLLVCKTFLTLLPPLITSIDYTSPALTQQSFERFAQSFPNLRNLDISLEYDDNQEEVDWSRVRLPKLRTLGLSCCPLKSIEFNRSNMPNLVHLSMSNTRGARFKLDLPELQGIDIEHTQVENGDDFGRSLSACPNLETFSSYKLWGIGGSKQKLRLPECMGLSLYRSDDADWLDIWAPNLVSLNLQACYGLKHVRLSPNEGTDVHVNLVNANIDSTSLRHLHQHPRVGPDSIERNDEEDDDMIGGGFPANMADMLGDHAGDPQMLQMLMMMQQFAGGMPHAGIADDDDDEVDEDMEAELYESDNDEDEDEDKDENEYVEGAEEAVAF